MQKTPVTKTKVSVIPSEGQGKPSLQLVNLEIASPADTYIKLYASCWRDSIDGNQLMIF
ncbi:MAG: hypothetical protein JST63_02790 [Bacteroidetes bacterium]|nr:hypothetical protein [Bacteroidota bacterium]